MTVTDILSLAGLIALITTTTVWFQRARNVNIPSNRSAFLAGWAAAGLLGLSGLLLQGGTLPGAVLGGLAIIGSAFFLGLYLLRKQGAKDSIAVGDNIPSFSAADDAGQTFDSADLTGTPALIKFFRGHW